MEKKVIDQSQEIILRQSSEAANAVIAVDKQCHGVQMCTQLMASPATSFLPMLHKQCNGLATVDIIRDKYPCLRQLVREYGLDVVKNRVKLLFIWCNELVNLQRGLTPVLIDRLADRLTEEYPYYNMTMQDLKIVIERGVSGQYSRDGELLVINTAVVIGWIDKYFLERIKVAEQYNYTSDECMPAPYERRSSRETLRGMITRLREEQNCR
jgi:hypothetical protein